jgi:peptide/nickel transport system permease protein|tara:strand:+ start:1072 stop:1911 length:840 start_codon:yes stop_codon:yes gene_type:complete
MIIALRNLAKDNILFLIGGLVSLLWIIIAIFSNEIIPYDPLLQNLARRFEPPSYEYWFGTDTLGRDIFSRVLVGSRLSLTAGLLTVVIAGTIGSIYGAVAGYYGRIVDDIMMRGSEMVMAFPAIILAMTITATLGPSLYNTILAMVVVSWPNYARVMRSMVIHVKQNEYVDASRTLGSSKIRTLFKEILPNSLGPVIVMSTLEFGNAILIFSGLSFLGLGAPPPNPEWGAMVANGMENFSYWWIGSFPGLAIFSVSIAANFIGDGLRDYLDPRMRKTFL